MQIHYGAGEEALLDCFIYEGLTEEAAREKIFLTHGTPPAVRPAVCPGVRPGVRLALKVRTAVPCWSLMTTCSASRWASLNLPKASCPTASLPLW